MYIHRSPKRNRDSILDKGILLNCDGIIYLSNNFDFYFGEFQPDIRDYWEVFGVYPEPGVKRGELILKEPIPTNKIRLIKKLY